jgi:O-antigen ligase
VQKLTHSPFEEKSPVRTLRWLEALVLVHAAVMLALASWGFGGGIAWVRSALTALGAAAVVILLVHVRDRRQRGEPSPRALHWLWPFAGFNLLVVAASFTPGFREMLYGTETMLVPNEIPAWRPSSARPLLALRELALFDALFLPAFNVALVVRSRRGLRALLLFAGGNALVLSVFGTLQKLAHAPGLFFGLVKSPQVYFFASFIYHNHWGAFILLMIAASLGLVWHYARHGDGRDFFHRPAFGGLFAVLLLAATVPLSGSRSSTLLLGALLGGALLHVVARFVRRRRHRESIAGPLLGILGLVLVGAASVWYVARETIEARFDKTREQVAAMQERGGLGSRATLYADTWKMARAKPVFGWGMASYPHVFQLYNTQVSTADRLPVFYADAHSDWLQAVAEHGLAGTALLGLCAVLPVASLRRRHFRSALPAYLLGGCALVLLYAWVEFPFGNAAVVFAWWLGFFCAVRYARLDPSGPHGAAA